MTFHKKIYGFQIWVAEKPKGRYSVYTNWKNNRDSIFVRLRDFGETL